MCSTALAPSHSVFTGPHASHLANVLCHLASTLSRLLSPLSILSGLSFRLSLLRNRCVYPKFFDELLRKSGATCAFFGTIFRTRHLYCSVKCTCYKTETPYTEYCFGKLDYGYLSSFGPRPAKRSGQSCVSRPPPAPSPDARCR